MLRNLEFITSDVLEEFFIDLLSSAATKRDAKAYITRLKDLNKASTEADPMSLRAVADPVKDLAQPQVNLGNFYGRARAVEDSPTFSQDKNVAPVVEEETGKVHVALVKLVNPELLDDRTIQGIGQTLSQLSRLSISPCVVIDTDTTTSTGDYHWKQTLMGQAERVVAAIDANSGPGSARVDNVLTTSTPDSPPQVHLRQFLLKPLRRGQIPVVVPVAYSASTQSVSQVSADQTIIALAKEFAGLNLHPRPEDNPGDLAERFRKLQSQMSLDRLIILDPVGGIPSSDKPDQNHVFVNLEQEYSGVRNGLKASRDIATLDLLRTVLGMLPPTSSALVTTPIDAAKSSDGADKTLQVSSVGTRRQRNALIHNLLTDKPIHSSSLPKGRLGSKNGGSVPPVVSTSTFVKRGMPLTILPDPTVEAWTPDNYGKPRLKLTDSRIDLQRLVHLIEDSFSRKLDVDDYLKRVNDKIAGIIIAGEYEGGALLTWETPAGVTDDDHARLVPYLDKFAVLKRSQGAGGVADILFNAMVRTCFPEGVCWRSRRNNPVNKWYFERARGTWKMPDTNWTMFWTTEGAVEQGQTFKDCESVCRGVKPSWADNKHIVD
jgi:amino-acid N-acetyltransferase